ncbi:MAG TPA: response regulator [Polyangia bacterium]|nr:response regulator [Polyangia bacterium]
MRAQGTSGLQNAQEILPQDDGAPGPLADAATSRPSILLVEDEEDLREALATLLEEQGYQITSVGTAERGLACLETQRYDLVICDYMLPGRTGAWMLQEAASRKLLEHTATIVMTAHPTIELKGIDILRKPLDIDGFLGGVTRLLAPLQESSGGGSHPTAPQRPDGTINDAEGRECIGFQLYISGSSAASRKAVRNMERLLEEYDRSQVQFQICDLARGWAETADEDHIVFTPTLVKRFPPPKVWLIGSLDNLEIVADLLLDAGVRRKH